MLQGQITTDRVRAALKANGYDAEFLKTTFVSRTSEEQEQHKMFFINEDTGTLDIGFVYVWKQDGRLIADW